MIDPKRMDKFKKSALELNAEVEALEQKPKDPANDTPLNSGHGRFLTKIYEIGCQKIADDKIDDIKIIAKSFGQSAAGMREENPFEWLMLAFYGAVGPVDTTMRAKCKRLALLLLYARQLGVKPKRLIGRLYEDGGFTRINKLMRVSNPLLFQKRLTKAQMNRANAKKQRERRMQQLALEREKERPRR